MDNDEAIKRFVEELPGKILRECDRLKRSVAINIYYYNVTALMVVATENVIDVYKRKQVADSEDYKNLRYSQVVLRALEEISGLRN